MAKFTYFARMTPVDGGGFEVTYPQFSDLRASGGDSDEALRNAEGCLQNFLSDLVRMGGKPPLPDTLQKNARRNSGALQPGIWLMITFDDLDFTVH